MRSQKLPWPPLKPNSLGNWVLATNKATPDLKPIITVSDTKLTMAPARTGQARMASAATSNAVAAASGAIRVGSPPARAPSVEPVSTEIADVTVIVVWRELQNSQNSSPENRQAYKPASGGRSASDASAMPAGSK